MLFIIITLFLSTHYKYSAFVGLSVRFRFQDPRQLLIPLSLLISYSPSGLSVHFRSRDPRRLLELLFSAHFFAPSGLSDHSCSLDPRRPPELLFSFHFFQFSLLTWVSQRISASKTHASSFICSFCSDSRFHSRFPRVSQIIFAPQTHDLLFPFHLFQFSLLTWVSQRISAPKTHAGFLIQIKPFAFFWCPTGFLLTSVFYFLTAKNGHHSSSSRSGAHFIYNLFEFAFTHA